MDDVSVPENLVELTADIVSSYVANNQVSKDNLGELVIAIHRALAGLTKPAGEKTAPPQQPAVPISKSVTPNYIICLEDGKQFKTLKRHLRSAYGMTPAEYRTKWNLPFDYPMVAPSYAAYRSAHAKTMGLGAIRLTTGASPAPEPAAVEQAAPTPRKHAPRKNSA
ncbi:hypothetical protein GCM10019059_43380 [Camelimonas fluminis]|uniref:MucR family transcriptional regulator n=1 Tax=Camelimonas fluminis TaxID=1576911 RepID=A0ABV7UCC2_9HYPH|nr:MucR family transcriptional regulator [Camelimonas fluminis]GHE80496.1 hypothetical protein GCM10019059_43380 [Camelimonas fluminis]